MPRRFTLWSTDAVAPAFQSGAEERFGFAAGVAVGGVEEVDAGLERAADELVGELAADLVDGAEAGAAERGVLQVSSG